MLKRSLLVSLAVVVTAVLILVGCSQTTDPESSGGGGGQIGGGTVINLKNKVTAQELANALADNAEVILIGDYSEAITLVDTKDETVTATTLHIPEGRTLTIGKNVIFILDDDHLSIDGTLKVDKGGTVMLQNDGSSNPDATGNLIGEIIIEDGGIWIDASGSGTVWGETAQEGTGRIVYKAGSVAYWGGTNTAYTNGLAHDDAKARKRIGPEDDSDAKYQLLNGEIILKKNYFEFNGDAYLPKGHGVSEDAVVQINAGKTVTLTGYTDADGFVIISGPGIDDDPGGKLIGQGKLVAGNTEFVGGDGGLRAHYTDNTKSITIWAKSKTTSWLVGGDAVLTGGAGATITQKAGLGNSFAIGDTGKDTVINLGGTTTLAAAQLILEGDADGEDADLFADNPGRVVFKTTLSAVQIGAAFTANGAFTGAAKIGDKTFDKIGTPTIYTNITTAAGKFLGLKATVDGGIAGGIDGITIDSTQNVAAQ
ncbi:hypothetical protein LQZ21_09325 [Treponema sp. TIM-1]|uniref:hypothetical protein n=1 Tax=Treponema sp. TIM-1 TaxID=2898417 RepID=UPI0039815F27